MSAHELADQLAAESGQIAGGGRGGEREEAAGWAGVSTPPSIPLACFRLLPTSRLAIFHVQAVRCGILKGD